jgi:hypothetical protein
LLHGNGDGFRFRCRPEGVAHAGTTSIWTLLGLGEGE